MMLELRTPWPVLTPKGPAKVYMVESLSIDTPVYYHVFVDATGEPWVFRQQDIRLASNETEGRQAEPRDTIHVAPFTWRRPEPPIVTVE